jgi:hypothetical protein
MSKQQLSIVKENGEFAVKDTGSVYPRHSVLAGQPMIKFIDSFDTLEEAQSAFPDAQVTHALMMPVNTFDHLPDDTDY